MRVSQIVQGYRFDDIPLNLSANIAADFRSAIGDGHGYRNDGFPLGYLALLCGEIMKILPGDGHTLHTSQRLKWFKQVELDRDIVAQTSIKTVRKRGNTIFYTLEVDFYAADELVAQAHTGLLLNL